MALLHCAQGKWPVQLWLQGRFFQQGLPWPLALAGLPAPGQRQSLAESRQTGLSLRLGTTARAAASALRLRCQSAPRPWHPSAAVRNFPPLARARPLAPGPGQGELESRQTRVWPASWPGRGGPDSGRRAAAAARALGRWSSWFEGLR